MKIKRLAAVIIAFALLASSSIISLADTTSIDTSNFNDIEGSFAFNDILWGAKLGVIKGYPDGTFQPTGKVTRVEFLSMMMRMCDNVDKNKIGVAGSGQHWGQNIYNEASNTYKLPINWLSNTEKDKPITRGEVAIIIAAKHRFAVGTTDAVQYMYDNTLSYGKVAGVRTYENYGVADNLTREQAAAFLHRVFDVDFTSYKGKESDTTGNIMGGLINPISFIQAGLFDYNGKPVLVDPSSLVLNGSGGKMPANTGVNQGDFYVVGNPAVLKVNKFTVDGDDNRLGKFTMRTSGITEEKYNTIFMLVQENSTASDAGKVVSFLKANMSKPTVSKLDYISGKVAIYVSVCPSYDEIVIDFTSLK